MFAGKAGETLRATLAVIPPWHAPVPCGPAPIFLVHSTRPRSLSMAINSPPTVPVNAYERNPRYPMYRSSTGATPGSPLTLTFHARPNPGFCIFSMEIFASERAQPLRCASPPAVDHSRPPPLCANAAPDHANAQLIEIAKAF